MVTSIIDIRRVDVVQRLVIPVVVVILHEGADLLLQLRRTVIMLQENEIFHGTVIPLDLPLRHRVIRFAACVADSLPCEILTEGF